MQNAQRFHRRTKAAQYITDNYFPCSPRTLAKLACTGGGPPYRLAGRFPIYDDPDLDAWALARIGPLRASTSELAELGTNTPREARADTPRLEIEPPHTRPRAAAGSLPTK
jgi:hypothetical protein